MERSHTNTGLDIRNHFILRTREIGDERAGHIFQQHLNGGSSFFTQNFYNCREELISIDIF